MTSKVTLRPREIMKLTSLETAWIVFNGQATFLMRHAHDHSAFTLVVNMIQALDFLETTRHVCATLANISVTRSTIVG